MITKLIALVLFCCTSSFAANCVTNNTCPASCPTSASSTTFTAIPNTDFTSPVGTHITSVDCVYCFKYDSATVAGCPANTPTFNPGQFIMGVFAPHGFATASLQWVMCWHGGGGFAGLSDSCIGTFPGLTSDNTGTPIKLIQSYIDYVNLQGGKGVGLIDIEYSLSTAPGIATFPQQPRDVFCAVSAVVDGVLGFVPTAPLAYYGPSWGGTLSYWAGNVLSAFYGGPSPTCLFADARPVSSRTVSAWSPMSYVQPNGSSFWENSVSPGQTAVEDALNCVDHTTCLAEDVALSASPYLSIVSGNRTQMLKNAQMFQFTLTDTLVSPYWNASAGGNWVLASNAFRALGLAPDVRLYPDAPSFLNNSGTQGGHEIGLGNIGIATLGDAMTFILGLHSGGSGVVQ